MKARTVFASIAMLSLLPFQLLAGQQSSGTATSQSLPPAASAPPKQTPGADLRITMPGSPLGIAWAFLYGYQGMPAGKYKPVLHELGAGLTKVYLIWNQIEPEKGRYDWSASDAFVNQLDSPDSGLISIFSSSTWGSKLGAPILPPSPAKNLDDYYEFIHQMVSRYKGRVRYWQNDSEPNNPVYWSGTKEEFVAQLKVFYKAVKDADPSAIVVVGGYDGLFNPPPMPAIPYQQAGLSFFEYVLKEGHEAFDVFDLRLYGDPYTIQARVEYIRQKMLGFGYDKPIICTEYGGPNLMEFPVNRRYVSLIMSWSQSLTKPGQAPQSAGNSVKTQIADMYKNMATLPPQTQMFMQGCSPELQARYDRIQSRGLVMRNIFALSAGVQKTLYWQLLQGVGDRDDLMTLMYGKIGMAAFDDPNKGTVKKLYPVADAFKLMASFLNGVEQVKQIQIPDKTAVFFFEVDRGKRGPLYVVWERRDAFSGEDTPATSVELPWNTTRAAAEDALGQTLPVEITGGRLKLSISLTPIYIETR